MPDELFEIEELDELDWDIGVDIIDEAETQSDSSNTEQNLDKTVAENDELSIEDIDLDEDFLSFDIDLDEEDEEEESQP